MKSKDLAGDIAERTGIKYEEVLRIWECAQCMRSAYRHYKKEGGDKYVPVFCEIVKRYKIAWIDTYSVFKEIAFINEEFSLKFWWIVVYSYNDRLRQEM